MANRNGRIVDDVKKMRLNHQAFLYEPSHAPAQTDGTVGVLCIHGFTGSPHDMQPLGHALAKQGFAAQAPVLPGHGGPPQGLKGVRWHDWVETARDALRHMCEAYDHVFLAGLSMGGLITMHLAASEHHCAASEGRALPIRGIMVMAAPSAINDPRVKLVRFAKHVLPWHYPLKGADFSDARVRAEVLRYANGVTLDFDDPHVQKQIVNSARIPMSAIHELIQLNELVMRELPRVKLPALFFQGKRDNVVTPDSAEVLAAGIGSVDKRVVWLPDSGHVLPYEPDAPEMFTQITEFIATHIARP
jgi:carboxylesterase